ncbi:uncharacterized protein LOC106431020 isoform X4 [Brassica napus]|uniref:uncharacterized protein LOC106431020 isoform X4 n=1 Tax=Brassica napus TaxID=3708 RepID=UPI002079F810|nr:uncharacterized protein LOC106431020 isoform X4 [Brassica napus]
MKKYEKPKLLFDLSFVSLLSSPSSVKSSVHLLRLFQCGEDPEQSKLRAGLDSAIVREKPNIKWTDVAAVLHRKETALASNVILESAILTTVVVLSLTVYTFWAAKGGYDFNFLGHRLIVQRRGQGCACFAQTSIFMCK